MIVINKGPNSFELGKLVLSEMIHEKIEEDEEFVKYIEEILNRHVNCDFGNLEEHDLEINRAYLNKDNPGRIFSMYKRDSDKIYVITEHDRSITTVLFPEEY